MNNKRPNVADRAVKTIDLTSPTVVDESLLCVIKVEIDGLMADARPFEFEYDQKGNVTSVLKYATGCPHCGHGVVVTPGVGMVSAVCDNCGRGTRSVVTIPAVDVKLTGALPAATKTTPVAETVTVDFPFVNPVKAKLMTIGDPGKSSGLLIDLLADDQTVGERTQQSTLDLGLEEDLGQ